MTPFNRDELATRLLTLFAAYGAATVEDITILSSNNTHTVEFEVKDGKLEFYINGDVSIEFSKTATEPSYTVSSESVDICVPEDSVSDGGLEVPVLWFLHEFFSKSIGGLDSFLHGSEVKP